MPAIIAALTALHDAGAVLVAGTDAGIAPIKPPDSGRFAPAAFLSLGMTPVQALRAVTSVAARAIGLGSVKGRIAPGFHADLLAVDGDPLADMAALQRIRAVLCRGNLVSRSPV